MSHTIHPISIINAQTLREKMDQNPDMAVINVLDKEVYLDCSITDSLNIPYNQLVETVSSWEKDKEITVYCAQITCPKSKQAYELLSEIGFTNLHLYEGGIKDWLKKGYDTTGACMLKYLRD